MLSRTGNNSLLEAGVSGGHHLPCTDKAWERARGGGLSEARSGPLATLTGPPAGGSRTQGWKRPEMGESGPRPSELCPGEGPGHQQREQKPVGLSPAGCAGFRTGSGPDGV